MRGLCLALALAACVAAAADASRSPTASALVRLLNARQCGSPQGYAAAAERLRAEADGGGPLQRYVLATASDDPDAPAAARLDAETRARWLKEGRAFVEPYALENGNALATYLLSLERNDTNLLARAAALGNIQAMNAWGMSAVQRVTSSGGRMDPAEAKVLLERAYGYFRAAALAKDANGLYNYGTCLLHGFGCARNAALAFEAFRTSADLGHPEAINNLGGFYRDGLVVTRDLVAASRWFEKSATLGNDFGQLNWGLALLKGEGVERDEEKALVWLNRSAAQGNATAMDVLSDCHARGVGGLAASAEESLVWKLRARAALGDAGAKAWLEKQAAPKP